MSSGISEPKDQLYQEADGVNGSHESKNDSLKGEHADILHDEVLANSDLFNDAVDGENREHGESLWTAAKGHPWACLYAFTMCFTIVSRNPSSTDQKLTTQVMEAFDMFLNGNFVALPSFQKHYGVQTGPDTWVIPTRWQSALFQSGQCGAFIGVFMAGPITNRLGYRWTTILGLVLMNATIFISFFVSNIPPDVF
jgi:SP family general alpha glucoside:H+ symporter-like MFS transporter